jgi:hypothetical protein
VPRIGFRRTRAQRSGTQSALADGTRTRWLFEMRRRGSSTETVRAEIAGLPPVAASLGPAGIKPKGGQEGLDGCILGGGQRIGLVERQITVVDF